MDSDELQSIYNDIVGKNQEHIILDFKVNSDRDEVMEAIENGSNRKWHF